MLLHFQQRQINVKSKFDIIKLTNRRLNGDNVLSILLGYQCSNDLRYVLFTHNVKYVSSVSNIQLCKFIYSRRKSQEQSDDSKNTFNDQDIKRE